MFEKSPEHPREVRKYRNKLDQKKVMNIKISKVKNAMHKKFLEYVFLVNIRPKLAVVDFQPIIDILHEV